MDRAEFFAVLAPYAVQLRLEGSPMFPSVRLAQNLLETGGVIHPWHNLGGIKVGLGRPNEWWDGSSVNKKTWEVINGVRVETSDNFRAYPSVYHFYKDQDLFLQQPRYDQVRAARSPEEQAVMLQRSGYATDPAYADKLISIIGTYGLKRHDREVEDVLKELKELKEQLAAMEKRLEQLERRQAMPVPDWAKTAVEAAVAAGVVDTPENGSYDFYRLLTVMHRKGLI